MSFTDKLKQQAAKAAEAAQKAAHTATEKAGELADKHGDKVTNNAGSIADKAGAAIDRKTGGKYSSHIEKAKGVVVDGVVKGTDRLAQQHSAQTRAEHGVQETQTQARHTVEEHQRRETKGRDHTL